MWQIEIIFVCFAIAVASAPERWIRVREDVYEYNLVVEHQPVASATTCVALGAAKAAGATPGSPTVSAVQFVDGACRLLACARGPGGCRKCRNFANASLPHVWIPEDISGSDSLKCWRTFLHRVDESVDFNKNWASYKSGFGQGVDLNYWIGLNQLHQLTSTPAQPPRVLWEMSLWNDTFYWTVNDQFLVRSEAEKYQLIIGSWNSSVSNLAQCPVGIALNQNGSQFSTFDSDNDGTAVGSCAFIFQSGWWFNNCHCFNPTGRYLRPPQALDLSSPALVSSGITYLSTSLDAYMYPFNRNYSMKSFEALIEYQWP